MWALIFLIVCSLIGLGYALAKDGEPRGNYNFWLVLVDQIITWFLLYEAGLFDKYI